MIPTRNQAPFIRQCIESCLAQDLRDAEIIVVDGASTDGTTTILASYGDRISYVSERDRGQSDAINKGIARARGDVIAWINSDDYYASSSALRPLVDAFEADATLDIAYGDGVEVDVRGNHLRAFQSRPLRSGADILVHPASPVMQPSLLFRRQLYLDVGGLDEGLHFTMDYDLWFRMFDRARRTRYVPGTVACARYHNDAKSVAGMGKQIRELCRVKARLALHASLGAGDLVRMQLGIASLLAYWVAVRTGIRRVA